MKWICGQTGERSGGVHWFWRLTAMIVMIAYSAACTHMPTGEKAFDSFETCFAANLGLAAVGGVSIGILGSQLVGDLTGNKSAGKTVGTAAGIATAAMIAMTAWRKCGAVYGKSEPVKPQGGQQQAAALAQQPAIPQKARLNLDRLEVRVEGTENDPPIPEFDFTFFADDPAAKDIKAKFRHKVEIVRFKAGANDKLVLADERGEALRDASGREIPLENAARMPRERLSWVPIAEEGKDEYVEDVVIQQGQRVTYRHKLQVPPRDKLPLPLPVPMRYTLGIEAGNMKSARMVDFAILGNSERPKHYHSSVSLGNTKSAASAQTAADGGASAKEATMITQRRVQLFSDNTAKRKPVGFLLKGVQVRVEERAQVTMQNKSVDWVKVVADSGAGGWLPANQLSEVK